MYLNHCLLLHKTLLILSVSIAPARISSFGGVVVGAAGGSLSLRCVVGGAPPPAKRWLRGGNPLHPRPPFHLDGDALLLRGLYVIIFLAVVEMYKARNNIKWTLF